MVERRKQKRLTLDELFTVHCLGEPCRVANVSLAGLGVTYLGDEDWPENITLEYSLPQEANQKRLIQCLTIWECGMIFYRHGHEHIIQRRGLEFVDQRSVAVDELHCYLTDTAVEKLLPST